MSILLISRSRNMAPFRNALLQMDDNIDVEIWPAIQSKERVNFAVAWNQPKGQFSQFPNLKVISSLGAGADHLINDPSIPDEAEITRVVSPGLSGQMGDYVLMAALNIIKRTFDYYKQQLNAEWKTADPLSKNEVTIGVMGLGEIGQNVAKRLAENGFRVSGWSKSKKSIKQVTTYSENELGTFLSSTNILVCLLPLTSQTEGILSLELFKQLKQPAFLINAARGEHLVEEDLIYALDMNLIHHAVLDVFHTEPLPESHPFWGRPHISITPHIASLTDPFEIAGLILDNYKRMLSGLPLKYQIDRKMGY
jgi:glyoxylate/hydroxypyruvate reductase